MAVDDTKFSSKPNGTEGSDGDKEEGKQDLKSIEDEFTQLKEKFFSDKIAAVKAEIEQIELGTSLSHCDIQVASRSPISIFTGQGEVRPCKHPLLEPSSSQVAY